MLANSLKARTAIVALALALGCGTVKYSYDYAAEPDPRKQEYVVGAGDRIHVVVWRNADLTVEVQVRPDGTITMPLIGDMQASGSSPTQIKERIVERLSKLYTSESINVTVAVREVASIRFTVTGNVVRPGVTTMSSYVTVLDAIELAGGLTKFGDAEKVVVIRTDAKGVTRRIPINYLTLKSGEDLRQNIVILRGDLIHVP